MTLINCMSAVSRSKRCLEVRNVCVEKDMKRTSEVQSASGVKGCLSLCIDTNFELP